MRQIRKISPLTLHPRAKCLLAIALAEVDSEVIFRMADDTLCNGRIDLAAFKARLALCKGQVSAVMASKNNPNEVVVIKGNKPLEIRYSKAHQAAIYASDARYLDVALAGQSGWQFIGLSSMKIATFTCDCLDASTCEPFDLVQWSWRDRY